MHLAAHLLVVLVLLAPSAVLAGASWTLRIAAAPQGAAAQSVAAFVEDLAGSDAAAPKLEVQQAAGVAAIRDALARGSAAVGMVPLSDLVREEPLLELSEVPFLVTTFVDAQKLWAVLRPHAERVLAARGQLLLFAAPEPPPGLLSSRPFSALDDFASVRLHAPTRPLADFASQVGARAVSAPSLRAAFQRRSVDAVLVGPDECARERAWEFAPVFVHAPAWFPLQLVVVDRRALAALASGPRDALLNAADRGRERGWGLVARETERRVQMLRDYGMRVQSPPASLFVELERLGRAQLLGWSERVGEPGARLVEQFYAIK